MYRHHRLYSWRLAYERLPVAAVRRHASSRLLSGAGRCTQRSCRESSRSIHHPEHRASSSLAVCDLQDVIEVDEKEDTTIAHTLAAGTALSHERRGLSQVIEDLNVQELVEGERHNSSLNSDVDVTLKVGNTIRSSFFSSPIIRPPQHEQEHDRQCAKGREAVKKNGNQQNAIRRQLRLQHKVDLSYCDVRRREADASTVTEILENKASAPMRSNRSLRKVLAQFIAEIQPHLTEGNVWSMRNDKILDQAIQRVFTDQNLSTLREKSYDVEDVMVWSWILSSKPIDLCIKRYVGISRERRARKSSPLPWFLCLQILRHERIDAESLRMFWNEIVQESITKSTKDSDSAAIFLIRFLRHARTADLDLYIPISELAPRLLPCHLADANVDVQRLLRITHFYNRFLTLIALPVPHRPFAAVPIQQKAQLNIARFMHKTKPEIPINREGFRAFVHLQLRHEKTPAEKDWARAKGPRWPPWRQDELGIQASIEYPGQRSRAMMVLQRMRDAGYAPTEHERAAQILAGWDTDRSPTIQVRQLMNTRPMLWLKQVISKKSPMPDNIEHETWVARVQATRSVREAWLCFYSYMDATKHGQRKLSVYRAMFEKLFAKVYEQQSDEEVFPGDGKEVYLDTASARDRIYVPTEPPTVDEFYAQMIGEGIQPSGRFLAKLVDGATTLSQGLRYIEESSLNEVKKDVLRHAEKYSPSFIHDTIASIPNYLFTSYIKLLLRQDHSEENLLLWPSSLSSEEVVHVKGAGKPFTYASCMLKISEVNYLPPYNAILGNVRDSSISLRKKMPAGNWTREHITLKIWKSFLLTLNLMQENGVAPDMTTFRISAVIIQNTMILSRNRFRATESPLSNTPEIAKVLFKHVLNSSSMDDDQWLSRKTSFDTDIVPAKDLRTESMPQFRDLEMMFFMFAVTNDLPSVFHLLRWMAQGREVLTFTESNDRSKRQMLAAIRIALEGSWVKEADGALLEVVDPERLEEAQSLCESFGWATDDDVTGYLQLREKWLPIAKRNLEIKKASQNKAEAE